ncbi:MAG: hypothetical protein ABJB74_17335 [Gemmatimonas sp.]
MPVQIVPQLTALAQPFADVYADSKVLVIATTLLHLGGLLIGGGTAITTDRAILRVALTNGGAQRQVLTEVAATHKFVITALAFIVISGLMFLAADVKTFLLSPVYWSKMGVVTLLLINGFRLRNVEGKLTVATAIAHDDVAVPAALWNSLRAGAVTSIAAWFTILVLGVVLASS